jgi:hypothetical protein
MTITLSTPTTNTWLGTTNDWFTPANWSSVVVPTCPSNAIIPTAPIGGNFPVVIGANAAVGNITVQSGASVDVGSTFELQVCGNWTGSTTTTFAAATGAGRVTIQNNTPTQTINGRTRFATLNINKSAGVANVNSAAVIEISEALELQYGTLNAGNNRITFLSLSASHCAVLDNFSPTYGGSITGSIVAQRYTPVLGSNQHFIGSPVNQPAFSQLGAYGPDGAFIIPTANCDENESDITSPYGKVFQYIEGQVGSGNCILGNWQIRSSGNLENGRGYSAYLAGTTVPSSITKLTGTPNTGNLTVGGLGASNQTYPNTLQGQPMESNWNLVANPYLSTIDLTTARAGFQAQVQVWQTTGSFSGTWQPSTITGTPGSVQLAPFQGFMVRSTGGTSYGFFQSERSRAQQTFYANNNAEQLTLELDFNGAKDKTNVTFNPSATLGFDDDFDANKFASQTGKATLYTSTAATGNSWLAINTIPSLTAVTTIPMGLRSDNDGTMTITPQGISSFDPTSYIYLEDKKTNTMHNLRSGAYSFTANKADAQDRFVLHFTPKAEIQAANATCNSNGQITIEQPGSANWNYTITDNATNATMAQGTLNSSNPVAVAAPSGVYNITLTDNNGYQVIKNVQVNGQTPIAATMSANTNSAEVDEIITLNNTTTGATNQTWDMGNSVQFSTPMVNYSYPAEGVYTVTLSTINADGCAATTTQTITVTQKTATSLNNLTKDKLRVWSYENKVMVDFTKQPGDAVVIIYNLLGQEISNEPYTGNGIYSKALNKNEASYVVIRVTQDDKITTKKLFIKND